MSGGFRLTFFVDFLSIVIMPQRSSKPRNHFTPNAGVADSKWKERMGGMESDDSSMASFLCDSDDETVPLSIEGTPPRGDSDMASLQTQPSTSGAGRNMGPSPPAVSGGDSPAPSPMFSRFYGDIETDVPFSPMVDVTIVPVMERNLDCTAAGRLIDDLIRSTDRPRMADLARKKESGAMDYLMNNSDEIQDGCETLKEVLEMMTGHLLTEKAKREANGSDDVDIAWSHELRKRTFDAGLMAVHLGCWLMRQGDGGVDDPWFRRGHAIHSILNAENAKELARMVTENVMPRASQSGDGEESESGESMDW